MRRFSRPPCAALPRALARCRPRPDDDRGAVAVVVAIMSMLFVGLAALVVDHGLTADARRQAQGAADASALAAAVRLAQGSPVAAADTAARDYARVNYAVLATEWAGCAAAPATGFVAMNGSSCITFNAATKTVRVTLPPRAVRSIFGGIYGVSQQTVAGSAAATYGSSDGSSCVLCVLTLVDSNTGSVVATGDVYTASATFNNGQGTITATGGTIFYSGTLTKGTYDPAPPVKVAPLADPYLAMDQPVVDTARVAVEGHDQCSPSNYYYDISGCTSFAPGVYVLVGGTTHQINVNADDVMFFLTCSTDTGTKKNPVLTAHYCAGSGEEGANFGGAGKSKVTLGGLHTDATYRDFAVWVDRNNTTVQRWVGNADLAVTGVMYDANAVAGVSDRGNGLNTVIGRMVVGRLALNGQGNLKHHVEVIGTPTTGPAGTHVVPRLTQ